MSFLVWRRIVWVSALAAISSSLYAVDGVILIDQNRALAGNVTPGDAPGFPVTISQRGSYRLSGNITVPNANTTVIQITADYVTLDLNGFSISGPVVCTPNPTICNLAGSGDGVNAESRQGVRVLNGIVRGMGAFGIDMTSGHSNVIERVHILSNELGGIRIVSGRVVDSVISLNGNTGLIVEQSVATGNIVNSNGANGILANLSTVTGNTASRNQGAGISASCPSSIIGNTAFNNGAGNINAGGPTCALANNGGQ